MNFNFVPTCINLKQGVYKKKKKIILYHTHPQMGINTMEKVSGKSKDPIPRRLWEKMTDRWKDEMTP